MKFNFEVYNCNGGNPTAILKNCESEEMFSKVADKIYDLKPEVDQTAVILENNENGCTFQLVGGEFCGNACLTICGYMKKEFNIENGYVINKIIDENNINHYIKINSKCDGDLYKLSIPKELLIKNISNTEASNYIVEMNGITHIIIPKSFGEDNLKYVENEIKKLEEKKCVPDVLGIIFYDGIKIDPFIWIKRIKLLQNQTSCLSGSVAVACYLKDIKNINSFNIMQPTNQSYEIEFKEDFIDISGRVNWTDCGEVEI